MTTGQQQNLFAPHKQYQYKIQNESNSKTQNTYHV